MAQLLFPAGFCFPGAKSSGSSGCRGQAPPYFTSVLPSQSSCVHFSHHHPGKLCVEISPGLSGQSLCPTFQVELPTPFRKSMQPPAARWGLFCSVQDPPLEGGL